MTSVVSCTRRLFFTVLLTVLAAGVSAAGPASEGVNAAVEWNAVATQAFLPTQGTDPLSQSRAYAMLHAAIHDALNAIRQRYEFYTPAILIIPGASPDAAVAAAARDVLVALIPAQQPLIQDAYEAALAAISDGPAKSDGVILGQAAAASILDRRFNDGVAGAFTTPYVPTGLPGDYAFTPPFDFALRTGVGRGHAFWHRSGRSSGARTGLDHERRLRTRFRLREGDRRGEQHSSFRGAI